MFCKQFAGNFHSPLALPLSAASVGRAKESLMCHPAKAHDAEALSATPKRWKPAKNQNDTVDVIVGVRSRDGAIAIEPRSFSMVRRGEGVGDGVAVVFAEGEGDRFEGAGVSDAGEDELGFGRARGARRLGGRP
jgi:hypothetical protein